MALSLYPPPFFFLQLSSYPRASGPSSRVYALHKYQLYLQPYVEKAAKDKERAEADKAAYDVSAALDCF